MKTKPFNLEEALNGAKVVTRNGDEVTQLHKFNVKKFHCLCGVLDEDILSWTIDGAFWDKENSHSRDLLLVVEPKRIYLNVYEHNNGIFVSQRSFSNRENAIKDKNNYEGSFPFCKYIKTIEIRDEDEE